MVTYIGLYEQMASSLRCRLEPSCARRCCVYRPTREVRSWGRLDALRGLLDEVSGAWARRWRSWPRCRACLRSGRSLAWPKTPTPTFWKSKGGRGGSYPRRQGRSGNSNGWALRFEADKRQMSDGQPDGQAYFAINLVESTTYNGQTAKGQHTSSIWDVRVRPVRPTAHFVRPLSVGSLRVIQL